MVDSGQAVKMLAKFEELRNGGGHFVNVQDAGPCLPGPGMETRCPNYPQYQTWYGCYWMRGLSISTTASGIILSMYMGGPPGVVVGGIIGGVALFFQVLSYAAC